MSLKEEAATYYKKIWEDNLKSWNPTEVFKAGAEHGYKKAIDALRRMEEPVETIANGEAVIMREVPTNSQYWANELETKQDAYLE
jgi:hypothetical protein